MCEAVGPNSRVILDSEIIYKHSDWILFDKVIFFWHVKHANGG